MSVSILMPALSPTMTGGTLSRWFKHEGDSVAVGDVIAEIETDKATMEIEAVGEGVLGRIMVPEGTEQVPVNTVIAVLAEEGEDPAALEVPATAPAAPTTPPPAEEPAVGAPPQAEKAPAAAAPAPEISPTPEETDIPAETEMVNITVRQALRDAMAEEMRRDRDVFLMGEEVAEYQGAYKVSQGLLEEFDERRVIDTPITEQGFAGIGIGAAFTGLKPIVEFMTFNFAMQAVDHLVNSAAKTLYMSGGQIACPIVFRGPNGAAARVAAQHSQCYAGWYAHVPGLKVIAPYSAADAKGLLKSAVRDPNPVIFLENELLYGRSFDVPALGDYTVPIGKARVVRPGTAVTIIGYSIAVGIALQAAERLAAENIDAEVVDLRTLRPLDIATVLESLAKTNRAVTVEEGWPVANIGSELSAQLMEQGFDLLDAPVTRVTGRDVPIPYAANLEQMALPQPDDVVQAARAVCYRN